MFIIPFPLDIKGSSLYIELHIVEINNRRQIELIDQSYFISKFPLSRLR